MKKRNRRYNWILSIGIGICLAGCRQNEVTQEYRKFESKITQEECMFCSNDNSVFRREDILLSMCNVNTGEVIDLLLGNMQNSESSQDIGHKELNFSEEGATVLQLSALKGRDICEISLYLDEKSGVRGKAENRLCQECVEKASEGCTEYVIADHRNKEIYSVQKNQKLMFAGDYAAHVDWDEQNQKIDILFFYSAFMPAAGA